MKHKTTLEFKESEHSMECGLRMEWMTGKSGEAEIALSSGSGCGSPWLIFTRTVNGKSRYLVADIRDLIPQLDKLAQ